MRDSAIYLVWNSDAERNPGRQIAQTTHNFHLSCVADDPDIYFRPVR